MSLKEAIYYTAICDLCNASMADRSDYSAWANKDAADSEAEESDWFVKGGNHICDNCLPVPDFEDAKADDELDPGHGVEGHNCYAKTEVIS